MKVYKTIVIYVLIDEKKLFLPCRYKIYNVANKCCRVILNYIEKNANLVLWLL
jgi:hypothetical protein